jgi:Zn-dependent protease
MLALELAQSAAVVPADADVWAMLAGGFPLIGIMVFMLRKPHLAALADERGLQVGGRVIAWREVRGMQYGRSDARPWYRVLTAQGVVELADSDLEQDALLFQREIVERAGLQSVPNAAPPRELASRRVSRYEEWAPPPPPVDATVKLIPEPVHAPEPQRGLMGKIGAGVVTALALVLKFAKVAFLGGLKALKFAKLGPTALSMLVSVWFYAQAWGWKFGLGFVLLIFVHEMGHAAVMRAKGLRTSPIVFIPFVGAFIGIKDQLRDARTEAETAYGGPATGAFAATVCFGVFLVTRSEFWLGLAYAGFLLNLFNLTPITPLDGGRVVTAVSPWLWIVGLVLLGSLAAATGSPLLIILCVLGGLRAFNEWRRIRRGEASQYYQLTPSYRTLIGIAYFGLCGYLAWMTQRAHELGGHM